MRQRRPWLALFVVVGAACASSETRTGRRRRPGRRGRGHARGTPGRRARPDRGDRRARRACAGTTGTAGTTGAGGSGVRVRSREPRAHHRDRRRRDVRLQRGRQQRRRPGADAAGDLAGAGRRLAARVPGQDRQHGPRRHLDATISRRASFGLPGYDVQDIYADATGGVLLISRPALGSTDNHNCGDINHLCGLVANYPTARVLLRHVHGPLQRHDRGVGHQADRHQRVAARVRHRRDGRRQRHLHLVGVRAQRAHRLRRHELRRLLRRGDHRAGPGLRRIEHADERREHSPGRSHEGRRTAAAPLQSGGLRLGLQPQRLRARRVGSDRARSSSPCARTTRRPAASRAGSRSRPARRRSIPSTSTTTSSAP